MQRRLNDCYRQQRFPYPGLRLRRDGRAGRLHGRQCQGRRVDRAVDQALSAMQDRSTPDEASFAGAAARAGRLRRLHGAAVEHRTTTRQAPTMMKASFRDQGIAKVDRLQQDAGQRACSSAERRPRRRRGQAHRERDRWPRSRCPPAARYLGDWREGEKLAQNGRGMTWTDASADTDGQRRQLLQLPPDRARPRSRSAPSARACTTTASCAACRDPADPAAAPIVAVHLGQAVERQGLHACSSMPRFGHAGLLNEDAAADLMALLLDPKSPVNQ